MTAKIELSRYELEYLLELDIGECMEAWDVNGTPVFFERVEPHKYYSEVEIEKKYFIIEYYSPTKVLVKVDKDIYNN